MKRVSSVSSGSAEYKKRYTQYEQTYIAALPEPPDPMMQQQPGSNSNLGAAKTALTRQQRYNDKSTTQTTTVKGTKNAK